MHVSPARMKTTKHPTSIERHGASQQ
jgi:hypothetical protein